MTLNFPGRPEFHRQRQEAAIALASLYERQRLEADELKDGYLDTLTAAGCPEEELHLEWFSVIEQATPTPRDFGDLDEEDDDDEGASRAD